MDDDDNEGDGDGDADVVVSLVALVLMHACNVNGTNEFDTWFECPKVAIQGSKGFKYSRGLAMVLWLPPSNHASDVAVAWCAAASSNGGFSENQ